MKDLSCILVQAKEGNLDAKNFLIEKYKPLIIKRASSYFIEDHDIDDLIQIGNLTLLTAIEKYNLETKANFTSYLESSIRNNLNSLLRDCMKLKHQTSLEIEATEGAKLIDLITDNQLTAELIEHKYLIKALYQQLNTLSTEDKKFISFLYLDNKNSLTDWCKLTGKTYSIERRRRNRLLKLLKKALS